MIRFILCITLFLFHITYLNTRQANAGAAFVPSPAKESKQIDPTRYCVITARVTSIYNEYPLVDGPYSPEALDALASKNIVLNLEGTQDEMDCKGYATITSMQMNNVGELAPKLTLLQEGDIIEGRLNFHLPNPHGKMLFPEYHNGLQVIKIFRDDALLKDWSKEYVYYRHIQVVEDITPK